MGGWEGIVVDKVRSVFPLVLDPLAAVGRVEGGAMDPPKETLV